MGKKLGEHDRLLAETAERLQRLDAALREQATFVKRMGAAVSSLAAQANTLPGAVRTAVDELWRNQQALDWKVNKLLHVILPEEYGDPGSPSEEIVRSPAKEESSEGPQGTEEGTTPGQPQQAEVPQV
jgi:hypothetical protein